MPRALVTGARGFVGRYLLDELKSSRDLLCLTSRKIPVDSEYRWVSANICDPEAIRELINCWKPNQIYHLAGISSPMGFTTRDYYNTNVLGTLCVLEAAADAGSDVLVVGSAYAYGSYKTKIQEGFQLNPVNPYGASKAAQDSLAGSFAHGHNKVIIARPFNHTGPGQLESYLVPGLISKIQRKTTEKNRTNNEIEIGNAAAVRDFLDVRDVVCAYRMLLDDTNSSGVFNICSGRGCSVADLFKICREKFAADIVYKEREQLLRRQDIDYLVGDGRKLSRAIQWTPRYNLLDTVESIIETIKRDEPTL